MRSWYDIYSLQPEKHAEDAEGIKESAKKCMVYYMYDYQPVCLVKKMVEEEHKLTGIPYSKIFVGGFSQGAVVSLYSSLMGILPPVAGVIALSGYIPLGHEILKSQPDSVPYVFMGNGDQDQIIGIRAAKDSLHLLQQNGYSSVKKIEMHVYPGLEHNCNARELLDAKNFMHSKLA